MADTLPKLPKGPVASFSFNNKSGLDDVTNRAAKLMHVNFAEDRFGNANSAVLLLGNEFSYINLGNYKALKPRAGTISLWINVSSAMVTGHGYRVNPVILTKCNNYDDFYEAYGINYSYNSHEFCVNACRDSLKQIVLSGMDRRIRLGRWYHLVLAFDDDFTAFYVDGELKTRQPKKFETKYVATDSVLIGSSANKKNSRYLLGYVDDILFYDRVLNDAEIQGLYHAPNPNKNQILIDRVLQIAGIVTLLLLAVLLTRWQLIKIQKKKKERLELTNKLLETELRVNRGLMNPHFIYNSLYSVQSLILNHEIDQANDYLVKFSKLMRKLLKGNTSDTISLDAEIDLLQSFIDIENIKFEGELHCTIEKEAHLNAADIRIPIMMIQPFVENAVWHGLRSKTGEKLLKISFRAKGEKYLECIIDDNGTGRRERKFSTEENKPMATMFINNRLELLNKIYNLHCDLHIIDKPGYTGTTVVILIPVLTEKNA